MILDQETVRNLNAIVFEEISIFKANFFENYYIW